MKTRIRSRISESSYVQSLWFVGFAAILITLYRLLFVHTVISFPHFVFWDYWCGVTSTGSNLDTLFRVSFLLAAILILVVMLIGAWERKRQWIVVVSIDSLTVFILICYVIQPTYFFDGPFCRQAAGILHNKVFEPIAGSAFSRPEGMRPTFCATMDRICWVSDKPNTVHHWPINDWAANDLIWPKRFGGQTGAKSHMFAEVAEQKVISETQRCLADAQMRLRPLEVAYGKVMRDASFGDDRKRRSEHPMFFYQLSTRSEVTQLFSDLRLGLPQELESEAKGFLSYKHVEAGTVWVPFEQVGGQRLPWSWLKSSAKRFSLWPDFSEPRGLANFIVCIFDGDDYLDFAVFQ